MPYTGAASAAAENATRGTRSATRSCRCRRSRGSCRTPCWRPRWCDRCSGLICCFECFAFRPDQDPLAVAQLLLLPLGSIAASKPAWPSCKIYRHQSAPGRVSNAANLVTAAATVAGAAEAVRGNGGRIATTATAARGGTWGRAGAATPWPRRPPPLRPLPPVRLPSHFSCTSQPPHLPCPACDCIISCLGCKCFW